tara:strand:- start:341 stop:766 length:426 start_codon:yes stop_codon:yes gene_type:complete
MKNFHISRQMLESAGVGTVATFIGLGVSGILDKKINHSWSNLIGLVVEAFFDFFGQRVVFDVTNKDVDGIATKFIIAKIFAILATQLLFMIAMKLVDKKTGEMHIQMIRLAVGAVAFFVITYPIRKYWVFKKKAHLKSNNT